MQHIDYNQSLKDCKKALEVAEQIAEIIDERIEVLEQAAMYMEDKSKNKNKKNNYD